MPYRDVRLLRNLMGRDLEHDPRTVDDREYRVDCLSTAHMLLCEMEDWLFLEKEDDWKVWQNRTGTSTGFTVSVANGSHQIVFSSSLGAPFTADAGGFVFEDDQEQKYTINRFTSTTTALLSSAYTGSTNATMSTWTVHGERFYLPVDCARALAFVDRDTNPGPLVIVDRRTEERYFSQFPAQEGTVYFIADDTVEYDRAPDPGFTASDDDTASGTLGASSIYEVCYTTTAQGRESPPSVAVRVETSAAATHSIDIAGMEDTRDGVLSTGIYKNVYIRRLTSGTTLPSGDYWGPWLQATSGIAEGTATYRIDAMPGPTATRLRVTQGRKYMHCLWPPSQDMTLRVRYLRRAFPFVADSDVPLLPDAYHDAVRYKAALDVAVSQGASGAKIKHLTDQYEAMVKQMRANHLLVPNMPSQKRMRTDGQRGGIVYRTNGLATTDYPTIP